MTLLTTHPAQAQAPPTQSGSELRPSIPVGLLADPRLTPLCTKVWMIVDRFAAPTMEEIAPVTGSSPRAVQDALKRLESCGWLLRLSRAESGVNRYVCLHQTPSAARSSEMIAERVLAALTRRPMQRPITEGDVQAMVAWNRLCAETRKDAETWK